MADGERDSETSFRALTGHPPSPWQRRLHAAFPGRAGGWPDRCDLPTGLGKTSAIACRLVAPAETPRLPRRLSYVVNRRTIVD